MFRIARLLFVTEDGRSVSRLFRRIRDRIFERHALRIMFGGVLPVKTAGGGGLTWAQKVLWNKIFGG
jgi:hypothetical protein